MVTAGAWARALRPVAWPSVLEPSFDNDVDHFRGATRPGVALFVLGDYECPYTRMAVSVVNGLERELVGELRWVFRHFPLVEKHPHALDAARAAEAAALQDAFWPMHDRLLGHQHELENPALRRHAEALGLDIERFDADRMGEVTLRRVARDLAGGERVGISGTPSFFVDGERWDGDYRQGELEAALRERLG